MGILDEFFGKAKNGQEDPLAGGAGNSGLGKTMTGGFTGFSGSSARDMGTGAGPNWLSPQALEGLQTSDPLKWFSDRDPTVTDAPSDAWNAKQYLDKVTGSYDGLKPPELGQVDIQGPDRASDAVASNVGPSAMEGISSNPAYTKAQVAQMAALSDLAAHGGRNAASDANLAAIEQNENQNARGQREAVLQNMRQRGMGGSGAEMLANLTGSQAAVDRQSANDMTARGQEANTALAAGQGAASIGAGLENQQFGEKAQIAAAKDAAAKFNAANTTGVSEFNTGKNQGVNNANATAHNEGEVMNKYQIPQTNWQNTTGLAGAKAGTAKTGSDFYTNKYNVDKGASAAAAGGMMQAGGAIGSSAMKYGGAAALFASHGGKIPGTARVDGDSPLNDFVPMTTSPGEVVVPRSIASHGSKDEISHFVKHAPPVHAPGAPQGPKDREAMLSALAHLRAHGRP